MDLIQAVHDGFTGKFGRQPSLFVAPGRINLIGEHTDYNEGFVMPAAIDRHLVFAVSASGNDRCNIYAMDFDEGVTFSLYDLNPGEVWVNYLMGVIDAMQRRGLDVRGVDCVFGGNIPHGGGMSSSAALSAGFGFALNEIFGLGLGRLDLARIAQSAEHQFVGARVGIMDPYASLFGQKDSVLLLDCRKQTHRVLPFQFPDYDILLIDSHVKHSLAASAYNDRRASCEEGVEIIRKRMPSVRSLRDVSHTDLDRLRGQMEEEIWIKCLYVVEEIARTQKAAGLLEASDLKGFGALMYETHWGLSQAYDVSCPELDFLVSLAEENEQRIPGARLMGGGFGGCTINLIEKGYEETFKEKVRLKYFATFKKEPDFYSIKLSQGVHATHRR